MKLCIIGCSHHRSSVDIRARLALSPDQVVQALQIARERFSDAETVLLSTCNRMELYLASQETNGLPSKEDMVSFLAELNQLYPVELSQNLFSHRGEDAIHHLFMVAASLDSMVVGEAQILSQVKQAFLTANNENATGPITHHLFEKAYRVAKRVATETAISRKRVSIPSVAVADCAKQLFETFHDKNILLLGAGQMGEETLRYLQDEGAQDVVILNRRAERAESLADRVGGKPDSWERLDECLVRADLVVSTTGAQEPIVTKEQFQSIAQQRAGRTLFVLDLAVPRDFAAEIGDFDNVYLYCIDDLQAVCDANRKAREKEWPKAKRIVDEETTRYLAECNHRATGPTIQQLKRQSEALKQDEMRRLMNKLGDVDERSRREIERAFDRLMNKLLHPALESLREEANRGSHRTLVEALRRLFQIND
jgi:glutamyl-tRNA reductase